MTMNVYYLCVYVTPLTCTNGCFTSETVPRKGQRRMLDLRFIVSEKRLWNEAKE
jgi:hypothetical protein